VDASHGPPRGPIVALGEQQLGQKRPVRQLFAAGGVGDLGVAVPHRRQPQQPASGIDRGVGGLLAGSPSSDVCSATGAGVGDGRRAGRRGGADLDQAITHS